MDGGRLENHRTFLLLYERLTIAIGKLTGYEKMVTGRIGVEDIVEKGFKELINNKDKHIKILVSPKQSQ